VCNVRPSRASARKGIGGQASMLAETAGLAREVFRLSAAVAGQGSRRLAEVRLFACASLSGRR